MSLMRMNTTPSLKTLTQIVNKIQKCIRGHPYIVLISILTLIFTVCFIKSSKMVEGNTNPSTLRSIFERNGKKELFDQFTNDLTSYKEEITRSRNTAQNTRAQMYKLTAEYIARVKEDATDDDRRILDTKIDRLLKKYNILVDPNISKEEIQQSLLILDEDDEIDDAIASAETSAIGENTSPTIVDELMEVDEGEVISDQNQDYEDVDEVVDSFQAPSV